MKNHELLDLIGEANEDYVLAAGDNVARPRFRWKTLAALAACAALIVAVYPAYQALRHDGPMKQNATAPLHAYTVVEGGTLNTVSDEKVPALGSEPAPAPASEDGEMEDEEIDGFNYYWDAAIDEAAANQYDGLLRGMGMYGEGAASYPDWFAGAWIDHGGSPTTPAWLTVAIVDSFRTTELETEITGWCGSGVVFQSAKYSHNFLDGLMDPVTQALDGTGLCCGIGVDVSANCLGLDLYSDGAVVPDGVLAELARLDPDGDAIRVRVITQAMNTLADEVKKGPEPNSAAEPVFDGARAEPGIGAEPTPDPVEDSEWTVPEELPEAKYDLILEGE